MPEKFWTVSELLSAKTDCRVNIRQKIQHISNLSISFLRGNDHKKINSSHLLLPFNIFSIFLDSGYGNIEKNNI